MVVLLSDIVVYYVFVMMQCIADWKGWKVDLERLGMDLERLESGS